MGEDLQNPETWDFESAERASRVKKSRAVVSVALSGAELDEVSAAAEQLGMKLSEFIRKAALDRARSYGRTVYVDYPEANTNGRYTVPVTPEPYAVSA